MQSLVSIKRIVHKNPDPQMLRPESGGHWLGIGWLALACKKLV